MKRKSALPITVFYSYAHEDELLRRRLERHLSLLEHEGLIRHWHDRLIPAGTERLQAIDHALNEASIILLLISSDFLASRQCYEIEMHTALQRHGRGKARIIPIILRPCDWKDAPFAKLECLPRGGKPITEWHDLDAAFSNIVRDIRYVLDIMFPHPLHIHCSLCPCTSSERQSVSVIQRRWHYLIERLFKMLVAGLIMILFKVLTANDELGKYMSAKTVCALFLSRVHEGGLSR